MINDVFKNYDIKKTKQRELVYNIVVDSKEPATCKYILSKTNGTVDKATIYRIINLFLDKKLFITNVDIDGKVYYTIHSLKHVHYITCVKCHKKEVIDSCPVSNLEKSIYENNGFTLINHNLQFEGICKECFTNSE